MGGLAHYIEEEGIATTQISLIREHTEIIKPPRALWVSFDLGRPLGAPNDPPFQRSVLQHALELFKAQTGPVLEDFAQDAPDTGDNSVQVACPVNFQTRPGPGTQSSIRKLTEGFIAEIESMRPWYEIGCRKRNRTTTGVSGLPLEAAAELIRRFIEEAAAQAALPEDPSLPDKLRMACEDIKAYYLEAVLAQPGQPTDSKSLADWFWGETTAALVINEVRKICLDAPSKKMSILGKLLLIPRSQVHRFT